MLRGMFRVEYRSSQSFCIGKMIAGTKEIFQLYISSGLMLSILRKEVPNHGSFSTTPHEAKCHVRVCALWILGGASFLGPILNNCLHFLLHLLPLFLVTYK
jgi:hypothetical protein